MGLEQRQGSRAIRAKSMGHWLTAYNSSVWKFGINWLQAALVCGALFSYHAAMLIVHVHVHVKPEFIDSFKAATLVNARASLLELGVLRFEVVQQAEDPSKFVLLEIYRDADAATAHKETPHYPVWRDTVAPMMAEPRLGVKLNQVFPK